MQRTYFQEILVSRDGAVNTCIYVFMGCGLYNFCFEHFPYGYYLTEYKGKLITDYAVLTTGHKVYYVLWIGSVFYLYISS
jgi:hypothetical protein